VVGIHFASIVDFLALAVIGSAQYPPKPIIAADGIVIIKDMTECREKPVQISRFRQRQFRNCASFALLVLSHLSMDCQKCVSGGIFGDQIEQIGDKMGGIDKVGQIVFSFSSPLFLHIPAQAK